MISSTLTVWCTCSSEDRNREALLTSTTENTCSISWTIIIDIAGAAPNSRTAVTCRTLLEQKLTLMPVTPMIRPWHHIISSTQGPIDTLFTRVYPLVFIQVSKDGRVILPIPGQCVTLPSHSVIIITAWDALVFYIWYSLTICGYRSMFW